ncbi:General transcription factor II-I repeat domain-containing protein 2B [Dictyocoela muelleri]|nr:General transcription factor II-I repeat domain-containing protein 2B [Dictyocoela muelleri]
MRGKHEGFVALLKKDSPDINNLIEFHCILHQQNLCAKSTNLIDTLSRTTKIVNFIRANATRHRQFRGILIEYNEKSFTDLSYHSKIRWLSNGQVLIKVLELRTQILDFYIEHHQQCELTNYDFCCDVAFLCDIMSKQNDLNTSLQGKTKHIYGMWQKIQVFRKKLLFFKSLLLQPHISKEHFPHLSKIINTHNYGPKIIFREYIELIDMLIIEYDERFYDFEKHDLDMQLAFEPHLVDILAAPSEFQMELIELSVENILKDTFQ